MNTIGERVRELRTKKRLSMDALAKSISIPVREKDTNNILAYKPTTSASISNIENDRHRPSLDMAIALAEFFGVTLDWLILGSGKQINISEIMAPETFDKKALEIVASEEMKTRIEELVDKEIERQVEEMILRQLKNYSNNDSKIEPTSK